MLFYNSCCNKNLKIPLQDITYSFVKHFGKQIPPYVLYSLPYGTWVKGIFTKSDMKLYGLVEFLKHINIQLHDVLMFTHWGGGQFGVILFDKYGVERLMRGEEVKTGKRLFTFSFNIIHRNENKYIYYNAKKSSLKRKK